jgi:hypothetical protein
MARTATTPKPAAKPKGTAKTTPAPAKPKAERPTGIHPGRPDSARAMDRNVASMENMAEGMGWPYEAGVPDPDQRLTVALQAADDAFWAAIVAAYPEVRSGDLDPGSVVGFDKAQHDVVTAWLIANYPEGG